MVTKATRFQNRRTSTPGKVFTSTELLEAELGVNTADRKLYSKDAAGTVFQVAGQGGRNPGDYLQFENFDGAGLQGVAIKDGGRLWVKKDNAAVNDFADVWITRDIKTTTPGLGTAGQVSSTMRIDHAIRKPIDSFEWAFVVNMLYQPDAGAAARAGEHCAVYPRVEKRGDGRVWCVCSEYRDFTSNPTTGSVNMEVGCGATGPDPNNQRIGIHLVIGSANDTAGTNIVSDGIAIFAQPGYAQSKRHIRLQGQAGVGVDMRELDTVYSDIGVAMATNQFIKWSDTQSTPWRGSIGFSGINKTMALGGVPVNQGLVTEDRRLTLEINGVRYDINCGLSTTSP
ncbi:hypothetical protein BJF92_14450 [Rhizobium rhizosphaerae]|uniref:Uncharacterized protein n=1 Tax=Xaviernesmea rhizosphaerae TaxID=1672749 RepID=A0A1Q9ACI7_9HYPH|nr:hypothetical protein [Xaviernesmea rhizosphaerae]OLP52615.1 hypothetical protein BJF92_14450 [Xaviernesmea rhizosphaerae]